MLEDQVFDVVINNAFLKLELQPFSQTTWSDVENHLNVGVRAAFELTKAFSRSMVKRKKGHIINILSLVVLGEPPAQMMPYVIAKYALLGFHNALAAELRKYHIKVNAISPHMVKTGFLSKLPDLYIAMTAENLPQKRLLDPARIAEKVKALIYGETDDICGANIPISE
jgi:3-oxoacyl-[acyl-carrier protein] reductase